MQLLNGLLIVAKILLAADKHDGQALAEMQNLGNPLVKVSAHAGQFRVRVTYLLLNVIQRIRRVYGETDEDNVRVGV